MINKLLGVAAIAAAAYALAPAQAAHMGGGCSGANLSKTETAVENMADGDGKMGACGMHLNKAMHSTMAK